MRAALLAILLVGTALVGWRRLLAPARVPVTTTDVANLVERRYPGLGSQLISAVRFAAGEAGGPATNSPELIAATVGDAGARLQSVRMSDVVDARRATRSAMVIVGVLAAGTAFATLAPNVATLYLSRNLFLQDVAWPRRTTLLVDIEGDELVAARGDDIVIEATAQGVQPRIVDFLFRTASGERGRETMVTVGSAGSFRYRYTFKNAREEFTFYLQGGDDETREFSVRLVERPKVETAQLSVVPPAYTRLEPYSLAPTERVVAVLPGSRVRAEITTNKPVQSAALMAGRDEIAQAATTGAIEASGDDGPALASAFAVEFEPAETRTYQFALKDRHELENRQPVRFSVRVERDEAPTVRLRIEGAGEMITAGAILPIDVEFADTYGLARADLRYLLQRDEDREGEIALTGFEPYQHNFATSVNWPVAAVAGAPGDRITLSAGASDFDNISGPNFASAPEISFRIVTVDEFLAELGRREQEYRADFERLISLQERLRGDVLSVLGRFNEASLDVELGAALAPLERRQRNIAGSVNVIRQQFDQILTELRINRLATEEEEQRIGRSIVQPLSELARRDLVDAADSLRRWAREASQESASNVDPLQAAALSRMRNVLSNMLQWEGYQEVVSMLRDIMRLQQELQDEVRDDLERQAGDLFDE